MGYRPKKRVYVLEFEDPDFNGLEVKVRGLSTGQLLDLEAAREDGSDEAISRLLVLLADNLIEWNVEDDEGLSVPANLAGIRAQDVQFNMGIIRAWQQAVAGVSNPLDGASPSGEPSPEESAIPMAPLSPSLAS
jgi:hypothetical protein